MFEENSRVCFLGDSITASGKWIAKISDYYNKNLKDSCVSFYNCGVPGGTAEEAIERIDEDVLFFKPTNVVIMFGMNDGKRALYESGTSVTEDILCQRNEQIDKCISSIRIIANKIKGYGAKVMFCTPTPFDNTQTCETSHSDYQDCLAEISKRVKALSKEFGAECIDFNTCLLNALRDFQNKDNSHNIIGTDRVHPNDIGQELMAEYFLKSQGFPVNVDKNFEEWEEKSNIQLSENCAARFEIEQKIRLMAFVKWKIIPYHLNNGKTPEEGLQEELDNPATPDFVKNAVLFYKENNDKYEDLRNELDK